MSQSLTPRFFNMPFPAQVDSIYRTKGHDVNRLTRFVQHCMTQSNIKEVLRDLDDVHKDRVHTIVQIYNLSQEKNVSLSNDVKLTVETKFEALKTLLEVVIKGNSNGLLICGAPGIGKSFTAEQMLTQTKVKHSTLKGYTSNIAFYNFLYEHRTELIFVDDADAVFDDLTSLNILKAVLETSDKRSVSWLTPSPMLVAPKTFTFTGKIIFITNLSVDKMPTHFQALMSRILFVNFDVTRDDILRRIGGIARTSEYKGIDRNTRMAIVRFIKANVDSIKDLTLRTLIHSMDLYLHDNKRWRRNLRFMWGARS